MLLFRPHAGTTVVPSTTRPSITTEIAFASVPLSTSPTWTDVSSYLRAVGLRRGRNYEYERIETGTSSFALSNRDARFSPENTSGPYYGNLKPTRRTRIRAVWDVAYDLFHGFTKGYPQDFPDFGHDAVVRQQGRDAFYLLNMTKFTPGTTSLTTDIKTAPVAGTEQSIFASTVLPMPQAVPFTITIDDEEMEVTEIVSGGAYRVLRGHNGTVPQLHGSGATVSTQSVSFGAELSGARIANVLNMAGIPVADWQIADGIARIAESDDLAGQNMLEHLQLVAEAENGRLFVSRDGKITFRDRHWALRNERSDRATLNDLGTGLPYKLAGPVEHDESRIYNVVRITPASGNTQTTSDQASIDDNFERVLEKQWPLASDVEAKAASEWMVSKLKDATVRIPRVTLQGQSDPTDMWPHLLGLDIGQRFGFVYTPRIGGSQVGTTISRSLIVEGVEHEITPSDHVVHVDFSPADTTAYWRVGVSGYSELGETTRSTY